MVYLLLLLLVPLLAVAVDAKRHTSATLIEVGASCPLPRPFRLVAYEEGAILPCSLLYLVAVGPSSSLEPSGAPDPDRSPWFFCRSLTNLRLPRSSSGSSVATLLRVSALHTAYPS
jgi:hypothetical protein